MSRPTTVTTLPDLDIGVLPSLDAEVPCTVIPPVPVACPRPAAWRVSARCSACRAPFSETSCMAHRFALLAARFPEDWASNCCEADIVDVKWSRL
jgi:hypothetical protein